MSYNPPPPIEDPSKLTAEQWLEEFALRLKSNYKISLAQLKKFLAVAPQGWSDRLNTQRHPLYYAVEWPTPQLLAAMVKAGVTPPIIPPGHETVLNRCLGFHSSKDSSLLPYALLLESIGVDLDAPGFKGATALYKAVLNKDEDLSLYLIEKGARLDVFQRLGKPTLPVLLLHRDSVAMLEKLLPYLLKTHTPTQLVDLAVQKDAPQCLEKMLDMGWEISLDSQTWTEENKSRMKPQTVSLIERVLLGQQNGNPTASTRQSRL